jgi:hypothetical protein
VPPPLLTPCALPPPSHRPVIRCRSSKSLPGDLSLGGAAAAAEAQQRDWERQGDSQLLRPLLRETGYCAALDDTPAFAAGFDTGYSSDQEDRSAAVRLRRDPSYGNPLECDGFAAGFKRLRMAGGDDPAQAAVSILGRMDESYGCPLEAAGFSEGFDRDCDSELDASSPIWLSRDAAYGNPLEYGGFAAAFNA